ncbi:hypothetical protein [Nitrosospira sp. Nl5]|uniref:hypothetical protein n=1 Tax=Nitrosospira sp. Nl5 TaxID=200120 RepID=UPI00115FF2D0|nr:hypothetical protein [Nitrosospira sp. Nl5]
MEQMSDKPASGGPSATAVTGATLIFENNSDSARHTRTARFWWPAGIREGGKRGWTTASWPIEQLPTFSLEPSNPQNLLRPVIFCLGSLA